MLPCTWRPREVSEAISSGIWVDIASLVPPLLDPPDIALLVPELRPKTPCVVAGTVRSASRPRQLSQVPAQATFNFKNAFANCLRTYQNVGKSLTHDQNHQIAPQVTIETRLTLAPCDLERAFR